LGIALTSSVFSTGFNGLIIGTVNLLALRFRGFVDAWVYALYIGALLGGVVGMLVSRVQEEIRPAESVSWSWHDFWRQIAHTSLGVGILAGLPVTIICFILFPGSLLAAILTSLPLMISFGLVYQFVKDLPQLSVGGESSTRRLSWPIQGLLDSLCIG